MTIMNHYLIGALTSKPYAFIARPWELKNVDSVDVFDTTMSGIKLSHRGPSVLRILPRVEERLNEEWITDKARFSYDSVRFQRLLRCYKKTSNGFNTTDWDSVLSLFEGSLRSKDFFRAKANPNPGVAFFLGSFVDWRTMSSIENMGKTLALASYNSYKTRFTPDFRTSFAFENFSAKDSLLFINCNIRYESPLLNIKIRKAVSSKDVLAYSLGFNKSLNFSFKNLGNSAKALQSILESRISYGKIFVGPSMVSTGLGQLMVQCLDNVAPINNDISSLCYQELFPVSEKVRNPSNIFMLDDDRLRNLTNRPSTHIGHHESTGSHRLLLPSVTLSERDSTYINHYGMVRKSKSVAQTNKENDLSLFRKFITKPKELDKDIRLHRQIKSISGLFHIPNIAFSDMMSDFYMNDSVTKNSPIMAMVSSRAKNNSSSFKSNI